MKNLSGIWKDVEKEKNKVMSEKIKKAYDEITTMLDRDGLVITPFLISTPAGIFPQWMIVEKELFEKAKKDEQARAEGNMG